MAAPAAARLEVDFGACRADPDALTSAIGRARGSFETTGCFLARRLFATEELDPTRRALQRLIELRMRHALVPREQEADGQQRFDDGFLALCCADRSHGGVIYRASRRLLPAHQLSVHPRLVAIAAALMDTQTVIASDDKSIRIDHPGEDTYLFGWHQDYPYIMDSKDAVVFWIPLQDVDESNGCLRVALGSHRLGLLPQRVLDPENQGNNRSRVLDFVTEDEVSQFERVSLPISFGDALVFSTLTLHSSQRNQSSRARWTLQFRFGNYENPDAVARGWPGTHREASFQASHPDLVPD